MSRSNNTENPNPASKFIEWSGQSGGFRYWDKERGEKGERVEIPLPLQFVVLDTLSTVKGYSDSNSSGFWSNEVYNIKEDVLIVRTKKGIASKGTYRDVITDPNCRGAKYCQSVYVAICEDSKLVIANVQLIGAALSSWIEFRKKNKNIYAGAIKVAEMQEGKKGATTYQIPIFKAIAITPESDEQAKALDRELQEYLNTYFKRTRDEVAEHHANSINTEAGEDYGETAQRRADDEFGGAFDDAPPPSDSDYSTDLPF